MTAAYPARQCLRRSKPSLRNDPHRRQVSDVRVMRDHNSEYQVMNKLLVGLALSTLLVSAPAFAKTDATKHKSAPEMTQSEMLKTPGQNREPGDNGTFQ